MWDLIIAGMGPAGSTAATTASKHGLKVLGIDKAEFPRHKPCAAGLTVRAQKLITVQEHEYIEKQIFDMVIHMGADKNLRISATQPVMITSKRDTLDTLLLQQAESTGAEIWDTCRVTSVNSETDFIQVKTTRGNVKAKFLIGCDGVNSVARKTLHHTHQTALPAWEAEVELPFSADTDFGRAVHFDLSCSRGGYGWIFPKRDTLSVGVAGRYTSRLQIIRAFTTMLRLFTDKPESLTIVKQGGHLLPLFKADSCLAGKRVLLAGDAGGLVDAFLGEGLYYALVSGDLAAKWVVLNIQNGTLNYSDYQAEVMRKIGRELIISKRLASIVYALPRLMYYLAGKHPAVLKALSSLLSNPEGYAQFIRQLPMPWRLYFWNI
jgi:geranylgeranyl reductase family protein